MNRTDRLLAIVLELQGKGRQRAEDLALTFETSKRTIYRDIEALCEAGVPLVATPGQGYALMKGFFLPPVSFTTDEAVILLLGSDFMAQKFDAQYCAAAQSAARKIAGVLPEALHQEVRFLQKSIRFITYDTATEAEQEMLRHLRRAIIERTRIRFCYQARPTHNPQNPPLIRDADPYVLTSIHNIWYLSAYCHLRQDIRLFRLDRISQLELLPQTFERPTQTAVYEPHDESRQLTIRILFDHESAHRVNEAHFYYIVAKEERPDGFLVTLKARQEHDVLQWILGWGRHAYVLEPASLRQRMAEEAEAILHRYHPEE